MQTENQLPKQFDSNAFAEFIKDLFTIHSIEDVMKDNAKALVEVMGSENFSDAHERQVFMESNFKINLLLQAIKDKGKPKPENVLQLYYNSI